MKIQNSAPATRATSPRFGVSGKIFDLLGDFETLGKTTVRSNQIIYGAVILSRILCARSPNEAFENMRRDFLGWYFWFMGSPLMQTLLLLTLVPKKYRNLIVTPMNQKAGKFKLLWILINPSKLWLISSIDQIRTHQKRMTDTIQKDALLKGVNATRRIQNINKLFDRTVLWKGVLWTIGLAFTIFALGIGITKLNVIMTKLAVQKKQGSLNGENREIKGTRAASSPPSGTRARGNPPELKPVNSGINQPGNPFALYGRPFNNTAAYQSAPYSIPFSNPAMYQPAYYPSYFTPGNPFIYR